MSSPKMQERQYVSTPRRDDPPPADPVRDAFLARIERFIEMTSKPDWDSERAHPIPLDEWQRARELYDTIRKLGLPEPRVGPCGDGSVHFNWHRDQKRFLIECKGFKILWSKYNADDSAVYGESATINAAIDVLRDHFQL